MHVRECMARRVLETVVRLYKYVDKSGTRDLSGHGRPSGVFGRPSKVLVKEPKDAQLVAFHGDGILVWWRYIPMRIYRSHFSLLVSTCGESSDLLVREQDCC